MTRTCDQCGKHLITHRADARFCGKDCNNAWHNEQRRRDTATDKHLTPVSGGVGSRGGNVRSVDEARILQSESKERGRWRLVMEMQIHRTLLATGYFHVDDLDPLGVPPIASEVKGTLINSVRARGYMKSTEIRRKVAHAAANARKAPIYKITQKGRDELSALLEETHSELSGLDTDNSPEAITGASRGGDEVTSVGVEPGESGPNQLGSGVGVANPQGPPETPGSPLGTDTASPEPLSLLPEPDPEAWAA